MSKFSKIEADNRMITTPKIIANSFNGYFISFGRSFSDSYPVLNGSHLDYMGGRSHINMFLFPSSSDDVKKVILSMSKKTLGINDVSAKNHKLLVEKLRYVKSFTLICQFNRVCFARILKNT